ncbi:MAG: hypothetical protein ABI351_06275, partial [Herbaspirillum sp.]
MTSAVNKVAIQSPRRKEAPNAVAKARRARSHWQWRRAIGPLFCLLVWYVATTAGWVDVRYVPSPVTVADTLYQWIFSARTGDPYTGTWLMHAGNSIYRVLFGFFIA